MSRYLSFETDRLLLHPTSNKDSEFLMTLMNTSKWIQNIGDRNINVIADAEKYIQEKIKPQFDKLGYGNYTVIRKSDNAKLGTCGLYNREGLEGIDIGFAFLPQYEKQGYAFESANKIKEVAFDLFKINQLGAITVEENIDSQKLLEKLGLKFSKTIKMPNENKELLFYALKA